MATLQDQDSPLMASDLNENAVLNNGGNASQREDFSDFPTNSYEENGTSAVSHNDNNSNNNSNQQHQLRKGTLSSASFNILSTMVGGGSLSLPLAFHQAGNGFMAPFLLLIIAVLVEYSIYFLIEAALLTSRPMEKRSEEEDENGGVDDPQNMDDSQKHRNDMKRENLKGTTSYESVACEAFGPKAKYFAMGLVFSICFFTIIGYGVLLRDMLLPLSDAIFPVTQQQEQVDVDSTITSESKDDGPTLAHNAVLLFVIVLVTPLCTLRNLTALESVGAASMTSIFILAICISVRSIECNFSPKYDDVRLMPWHEYITYFPQSTQKDNTSGGDGDDDDEVTPWDNILNALPILISVFMCHFNVIPVHNELKDPTPKRVNTLFRITVWGAFVFYVFVGFIGSMYGNCTPNGVVESNVLLSFDENDVLLMIGRFCLSLTITFAFPILVVPARDVVMRGLDELIEWREEKKRVDEENNATNGNGEYRLVDNDLSEPLLSESLQDDDGDEDVFYDSQNFDEEADFNNEESSEEIKSAQNLAMKEQKLDERKDNNRRIILSITIFWIGAIIACSVKDIDVIWDILGGSLSLIMGFTMPSAAYLILSMYVKRPARSLNTDGSNGGTRTESVVVSEWKQKTDKILSWTLFLLFIPLIFILTGNAVYNISNS